MADEGRVVRIQDGNTFILADRIAKDGFVVVVLGRGLQATVRPFYYTSGENGERRVYTASFSTAVSMDN